MVLFSRPDVASLCRSVRRDRQIQLARHILDADIRRYVESSVTELLQERLLPGGVDMESIVSHLTGRAEGMFLWIRLMLFYLNSPGMTRSGRLEVIMEPITEGLDLLDEMYSRIQTRIDSSNPHRKSFARRALLWTVHASLSSSELQEALYPHGWDSENDGTDRFDHVVVIVCCGLLEKAQDGRFQFIHLTARVFAERGNPRSGAPLTPGKTLGKALLATRCLAYLSSHIPAKPLSGRMQVRAGRPGLRQQWPLLEFVTLDWITFLLDSVKSCGDGLAEVTQLVQVASAFLGQPPRLMVWIEAFYTYCAAPLHFLASVQDALRSLHMSAVHSTQPKEKMYLLSEMNELVGDLGQINTTWGKNSWQESGRDLGRCDRLYQEQVHGIHDGSISRDSSTQA